MTTEATTPPLPELTAIRTFMPGSWTFALCLATRWFDDDVMPAICAREAHPDDNRHVTHIWHHGGQRAEQVMWEDGAA